LGIIHGDPTWATTPSADPRAATARRISNLLDFGCIRIFPPRFVAGWCGLYRGLLNDDRAEQMEAYRSWGFANLSDDLVDVLNVWARFIYGPLLDDRVRSVADDVPPGEYGRREAFKVRQALKEKGPITIPASSCSWTAPPSAWARPSCTWARGITGRPYSRPRWRVLGREAGQRQAAVLSAAGVV